LTALLRILGTCTARTGEMAGWLLRIFRP